MRIICCSLFILSAIAGVEVRAQAAQGPNAARNCAVSSRTLLDQTPRALAENLPSKNLFTLSPLEYMRFISDQRRAFPDELSVISLDEFLNKNNNNLIGWQMGLVGELNQSPQFRRLMRERGELLTIKIADAGKIGDVERTVIDEEYLSNWGESLGDSPFNQRHLDTFGGNKEISDELLKQIKETLQSPASRVSPETLAQNLAVAIEGLTSELRRVIAEELKQGKITLLKERLPEDLSKSSFDPSRLGLEEGRGKQDYLALLEESIKLREQLDQLLPSYIFSRNLPEDTAFEDFLDDITEAELDYIKDVHIKRKHIDEIVDFVGESQKRELRRVLEGRLGKISEDIEKHKKTIVERVDAANTELTLTEVHPHLGILRGELGGDCSTSHSFGYPNSPLERVFFISNKRGEGVGYVNGTKVLLPDGRDAFFVNSINGARVSGIMAERILVAMKKSQDALGVKEIVLLGEANVGGNIEYSLIRDVYHKSRGEFVRIEFRDVEVREIIAGAVLASGYDMPNALRIANYLKVRDISIDVQVESREFAREIRRSDDLGTLLDQLDQRDLVTWIQHSLENRESTTEEINQLFARLSTNLKESNAIRMFRNVFKFKVDPKYLDEIFHRMPKKLGSDAISIFKIALEHKADPKYLDEILRRMPEKWGSEDVVVPMFESALKHKADSKYLDEILRRMPEKLWNEDVVEMFESALKHKADSKYLDEILRRMSENLWNENAVEMFESALEHKADSEYLDEILRRMPEKLESYGVAPMFERALKHKADPKYLDEILRRMPEKLGSEDVVAPMFESALKHKADPKYLDEILRRMPEKLESFDVALMFESALKHKADPKYLDEILRRMPEKLERSYDVALMFESALKHKADPKYLDEILRRMPEKLERSYDVALMFESALKHKADPKYLDEILRRMPEKLESENAAQMFESALEHKADSEYLDEILRRMPEKLWSENAAQMFQSVLEHKADSKYLDEILRRMPEKLWSENAAQMFQSVLEHKAYSKYLDEILDRAPEKLNTEDIVSMFENALEYKADPEAVARILRYPSEELRYELIEHIEKLPESEYKMQLQLTISRKLEFSFEVEDSEEGIPEEELGDELIELIQEFPELLEPKR